MRKFLLLMISVFLFAGILSAQEANNNGLGGFVSGGVGLAMIENEDGDMEAWYSINFNPELSFRKFGLGLNINLLVNNDGEIRDEDLKLGKIIRYLRYGQKRDPLYVRIGALDAATLGHGFILYRYSNQVQESNTRVGLVVDVNRELWGVETIASNLGEIEILGARGYYKPLKGRVSVPVIQNFAIGASMVGDFSEDVNADDDNVKIIGFDAELPLVSTGFLYAGIYSDFAKIIDFGSGFTFGLEFNMNLIADVLVANAKFERLIANDEFIPQYFDNFYEVDRAYIDNTGDAVLTYHKYDALKAAEEMKGWFGELSATILNSVTVTGNYQEYDVDDYGKMHLFATTDKIIPKFKLQANYSKKNIEDFSDAFSLDEDSIASLDFGYNINPFTTFLIRYEWTFRYNEENEEFDTIEKVYPRLEVKYSF